MTFTFIIIIAVLIFLISFLYFRVALPWRTDRLINETLSDNPPELIIGRTGFALNGEVRIAYEVLNHEGNNGQTILLINGHSGFQTTFPIYFYEPFIEAGYQVIKFDNRGLGDSDWIEDWDKSTAYNLENMAADAVAVLDHLSIEKANIIGVSMGGMIGQSIAIHHAEKVLTLTSIMSTGFWGDPALTSLTRKWYLDFYSVNFLYGRKKDTYQEKLKLYLAHQKYLRGKGNYKTDDREILERGWYELKNRNGFNPKVGEQHTWAIILSGSRYEKLKELTIPTFIIHGTDDPLILVEHSEKYASMIPHAKKLLLKGMGHDLPRNYIGEIHKNILQFYSTNTQS